MEAIFNMTNGAEATEAEEVTDLSDAPTKIKAQILENDRKLRKKEGEIT